MQLHVTVNISSGISKGKGWIEQLHKHYTPPLLGILLLFMDSIVIWFLTSPSRSSELHRWRLWNWTWLRSLKDLWWFSKLLWLRLRRLRWNHFIWNGTWNFWNGTWNLRNGTWNLRITTGRGNIMASHLIYVPTHEWASLRVGQLQIPLIMKNTNYEKHNYLIFLLKLLLYNCHA